VTQTVGCFNADVTLPVDPCRTNRQRIVRGHVL
jgi:hypothetical protein